MTGLRQRIRPWLAYLVAGCAVTGIYFLLPFNTVGQAVLYDGIGASSVVAVVAGTLLCKPRKRRCRWPPRWRIRPIG